MTSREGHLKNTFASTAFLYFYGHGTKSVICWANYSVFTLMSCKMLRLINVHIPPVNKSDDNMTACFLEEVIGEFAVWQTTSQTKKLSVQSSNTQKLVWKLIKRVNISKIYCTNCSHYIAGEWGKCKQREMTHNSTNTVLNLLSCLTDLINVEADRMQVCVGAALAQGNPHINSWCHCWLIAHCKREAGVLPVRQEVPASSGRPPLHPRATEGSVLPLSVCC